MNQMKKIAKRSLAVALTLVMCVGMLNLTAFAAKMTCEQKGSVGYVYVGTITVDSEGKQVSYNWHRKTQFTCYGVNGHSYNANHTFKWSELNSYGAKYFTRQSPGLNGQKINYQPVPGGTITLMNDQVIKEALI
jgi:hypothetical protein